MNKVKFLKEKMKVLNRQIVDVQKRMRENAIFHNGTPMVSIYLVDELLSVHRKITRTKKEQVKLNK